MAVCDVFDALTAMDRPYKKAMGKDTAFAILQDEAKRGLLDADMVQIFIQSGSHELAQAV
jgi:HD-GYP domain-containing protein (c-di-GMP phosphodiesterase class II)